MRTRRDGVRDDGAAPGERKLCELRYVIIPAAGEVKRGPRPRARCSQAGDGAAPSPLRLGAEQDRIGLDQPQ